MKNRKYWAFVAVIAIVGIIMCFVACNDWFDATLVIVNNSKVPYNVRVSSYGKPSGGWTLIDENSRASFKVESGNVITIELYTGVFHTVSPLQKGEERIYTLGSSVPTW